MDSTSVVIVAIPSEDDRVWKVSSEKVPHLTLLYLGKQETGPEMARVAEFIEHAANTSLNKFGLSVERRGELGPDKADVIFFEKAWVSDQLKRFRSYLLAHDTINQFYHSVEQYPSWTPHLTLGYPESPAKKNEEEHSLGWVNFDRIALWTGDYEGFEIPLKSEFGMEVAMSDSVDDVIAHYGVKGMRWGVRKAEKKQSVADAKADELSNKASALRAKAKIETNPKKKTALNRKAYNLELEADMATLGRGLNYRNGSEDSKHNPNLTWRQRVRDDKWVGKVNTAPSSKLWQKRSKYADKEEFAKINEKYKGLKFDKDSPELRKYENEINKVWAKAMTDYTTKTYGATNPSGTQRLEWRWSDSNQAYSVWRIPVEVKHAATAGVEPETFIFVDDDGFVVGFEFGLAPEEALDHNSFSVDDVIAHYGVKGMKWGVRRTQAQLDAASEDAKKAEELRTKAKRSGTNALSNSELRTAIDRMNLETQYARLAEQTTPKSKGRKFAEALLGDIAKQEVTRVGKAAVSLRVEKELIDRGHADLASRIKPKKK